MTSDSGGAATSLVEMAVAAQDDGDDLGAAELFRRAAQSGPERALATAWLAQRAATAADWGEALRLAALARGYGGATPWWLDQVEGVALIRTARPDEAQAPLARAAAAEPTNVDVAIAQVHAAIAAGDVDGAERGATRIAATAPGDERGLRARAIAVMAKEQWDEALQLLDAAERAAGTRAARAEVLTNLAICRVMKGEEPDTAGIFRDALEIGERTPFHTTLRANHRTQERRFPPPRSTRRSRARSAADDALLQLPPSSQRKPTTTVAIRPRPVRRPRALIFQTRALMAALGAGLVVIVALDAPIVAAVLAIAGVAGFAFARRRPAGVYRTLPPYAQLTVHAEHQALPPLRQIPGTTKPDATE